MISAYDAFFYGILAVVLTPVVVLAVGLGWWLRLHRGFVHVGRRMGARWWDASGPLVLATGVVAIAVLLGDVPSRGESGYLPFAFSAAALLLGAFGLTLALGNLDEYRQVARGPDDAGTVDDGPAVMSGTASTNAEALTGPLSGEPSLYHTLQVTERRGIGHRKYDVEIHYEDEGAPFTVDDGTGAVQVDPTDGAVRLWEHRQLSADATTSPGGEGDVPDAVEALRERVGLSPSDDQTFHEMRLEPETEVTVLGTAGHDPEARYPVVRDGDRRLVVVEGPIVEVRDSLRQRVRGGTALGVGGFVTGTVGVFVTAGLV